ncbi:ComEC/Rec2 family competence protein [Lutimonas saemankumensis]|uniref:ComEC/Rec2 family competence protein n=1 Tax=Lutimonas saemankumensis TaxID=483016 RepID=UPI00293D3D04|nr:ComEC/Rec2 family competence protein [Lutimonas saemankumensis]
MSLIFISIRSAVFHAKEWFKPPYTFVISSWVLTVFIGIYLISISGPKMNSNHFQHSLSKKPVYGLLVLRKLNSGKFYSKYLVKVTSVNRMKSSGFVWLRIDKNKNSAILKPGTRIVTCLELNEIKAKRNPGEFDYQDYSKKKNIGYQLTLENNKFFSSQPDRIGLVAKALNYRDYLSLLLNKLKFDAMETSLLEALLLGRKTDLKKEMASVYRKAGAMHLLAISGLHVGILLFFIRTLFMPLRRWQVGKGLMKIVPFFSLWVFAFITGLSPSVLRAVIMFSFISIALNFNRFHHLNPILFIAFFISLLWKPSYLFDPGFQLSYLAVLSIVNLGPRIRNLWRPKNKIILYLWNLTVVSIAAQIGVLPLILYYFHEFSGLFLFSSLLLIPLLGIILGFGYLLLVMLQFDFVPEFYIQIFSFIIGLMNRIVFFLSRFEVFIVEKVFFSKALLTISIISIIVLFFYRTKEASKVVIALLVNVTLFATTVLIESVIKESGSSFIVFQEFNKSLIIKRSGKWVSLIRKAEQEPGLDRLMENYQRGFIGLKIEKEECDQNLIELSGQRIMIVDSNVFLTDFGFDPDIIILLNSPKINLERFLQEVDPRLIVADGSNYNFLKKRWLKSAEEKQIPFYDTAIKGAFEINLGT